jgi:cobaltochelatase CobT
MAEDIRHDDIVDGLRAAHAALIVECEREEESCLRDMRGHLVTLLLDNSGSIKGPTIGQLVLLACRFADSVTSAGGVIEVLGFTTRSWKGGESRKLWIASGKPPDPGRLNDLRHIVYHRWDEPWTNRSWEQLAPMFDTELSKENLDGEALVWAYRRSLDARAARRSIVVVSDGAR